MNLLGRLPVALLALLSLLAMPILTRAQITEGSLAGTITDSSGAPVADAQISVSNLATQETRQITADNDGIYRLSYLAPGKYLLTAQHTGFQKALVQGITIEPSTTSRADVQLKLGSIQEVVEVSETSATLNTDEARLTSSLTQRQVQDLPLAGREVYSLALQQPGVTATLAPVISNTQFNTFNYGFSANGATPRGNNYVLDGGSNNNEWLGGTPAVSPSVEAIQTFQVETSNFAPEYGRTNGSIVAVTTRAGSNVFHGSVYDYVRNPVLDAHYYFDNPSTPGSFIKQNNFGFSVGGPIIHDRTFFFVNYEGIRGVDSQTQLSVGETPEFRQQVQTFRPDSIAAQQLQNYPAGACVPGSEADTGSIFGVSEGLTLAQAQAVPFYQFIDDGLDGIPDICTTNSVNKRPIHGNQFSVRIDHRFTNNDIFFARFLNDTRSSDSGREQLNGASDRGFKAPFDGKFPSILFSYIHLYRPNLLNELHFIYARSDFGIGFQAPRSAANNYPYLFFDDGVTPFGGELFVPRQFVFNNFTIRDSVAYTRGRHALKAGIEIQRIRENSDYSQETFGFYEFQDQFTFANDGPYYTEGRVSPATGQFVGTPRHFRENNFGLFVQDDWKATRRLSLNLGLRYDLYGVPTEANNILSNMILGSGSVLADQVASGTVGRVKNLYNGNHANFSPRLGVSYDPTGNGTTVVRVGFSMAYLSPYSNLYTNASRFDPPDSAVPAVFFPFFGGDVSYGIPAEPSAVFLTGTTPEGGIPGTRITVSGVQRNLKTAYSKQWFVSVQRKLFSNYILSFNYTGDVGRQLYARNDINRFTGDRTESDFGAVRFNPQWSQTFFVSNANGSSYNGINLQLQRQFTHHYSLSFSYSLGKSVDFVSDPGLGDYVNVSNSSYQGTMDAARPQLDHARSDFDVRHRIAINSLYEIPTPHWNHIAEVAFGGWQANAILSLQSGRPFSVWCVDTIACDFNGDGDGNDRPDAPTFGNHKSGLSRSDYLNGIFQVSDFIDPNTSTPFIPATSLAPLPIGNNGTLGRNTFQGPGFAQVDASLFKSIPLPRELNLQFRAEAFNLFNRVNLFLPNDLLNVPTTFGKSTTAFAPRTMQLALKLAF